MAADTKNVGAIAVEIIARIDNLEKNMQKGAKSVSAFTGVVAGAAGAVATFALDIARAAAAGIGAWVKHSFEAIDAAADLASSLNTPLQALRALQYAASLASADADTLNSAINKLQVKLGEAVGGNATAQQSFLKLGLSIEALARMDAVSQFTAIAEALKGIESPAQKAEAVVDLFGKSGQKLVPLLSDGAEGVKQTRAEFDALAGTINEFDAAKIKEANNWVSRLGTYFSGVADIIARELAPVVAGAIKDFIEWSQKGISIRDIATFGVNFVIEAFSLLINTINMLRAAFDFAIAAMLVLLRPFVLGLKYAAIAAAKLASVFSDDVAASLEGVSEFFDMIDGRIAVKAASWVRAGEDALFSGNRVREYRSSLNEAATAAANLARQQREVAKNSQIKVKDPDEEKSLKAADEAMKRMRDRAKSIIDATRTPLEKFKDTMEELIGLRKEGLINEETFNRAKKAAQDSVAPKNETALGFSLRLDNSRVSAEALRMAEKKVQKVSDPALDKTNLLLTKIEQKVGGGSVARTTA